MSLVRRSVTALLMVLLMVAVAAPATLAGERPRTSVDVTVSAFRADVRYRIDQPAELITRQTCWLRYPNGVVSRITCDEIPEASSSPTSTNFLRTLRLKRAGDYRFSVRFTLTSGQVIRGTRAFTIKPGPAVRFEVTGLFDQTIRCDARVCPGDWVNDVARQIVKVTARDKYGNRATGYTGTVVFDGAATTVSESKLKRGVGFFAVKPTGLELNQFTNCASGVPADQDYKALTVTDKNRPAIRGCQLIFYDIFFVLDPLPIFRIPNITPEGCVDGCLEDPTETILIDTEVRPIQVLTVETIALTQSLTSSVTIVGETTEGKGFAQELTLENPEIKSSDLPPDLVKLCTGCSTPGTVIAVELSATVTLDGQRPEVEATAGGGELKLSALQAVHPVLNFNFFGPVEATATKAEEPTCYRSHAAIFDVNPGKVACGPV
jgi:hypothetical protein